MKYARHIFMASRRSYNRWKCMIPVDYVVDQKVHREFIHDISAKGVFIGCKAPPSAGDQVILTFAWKQHYKSSGTVVRTDADGFAVQFTQPISIH